MSAYTDQFKVTVPEGRRGRWEVLRYAVDEESPALIAHNLREMYQGTGRSIPPGEYTRLTCDGRGVVMSDTPAEVRDHIEPMRRFEDVSCSHVLIHGLGLGMVLAHALRQPHIEHIDVVEIDPDVIALVGPHYEDRRLTIHEGDAYTFRFPRGRWWDVAWHDIWDELSTDNLELMARLNRRYARRVLWQGCWGQELLKSRRNQERRQWWAA